MVELQIINWILRDNSDDIITDNNITDEYFNEYKPEWDFIKEHKNKYGNVPNIETFLAEFPDFDVIQVTETEQYLVRVFEEEYIYSKRFVPIMKEVDRIAQNNTYEAINYLKANIDKLHTSSQIESVDIISEAQSRLDEYLDAKENKLQKFIPSGFEELDSVIGGFHTGEELIVLFARTGQGKSWVLMKMIQHAWKMNKRVGLLEPEMSANKVGYRFDTWENHVSNSKLIKGDEVDGYEDYIKELVKSETPVFVSHPKDFSRKVTVSKLRNWLETKNIELLAIDGISYLTDERKERGDSRTIQLTNISEDLMDLSIQCEIPIIIVAQSNREGTIHEELELTNIRDSDGIAYNASIVLAVSQKEDKLNIALKKSRNSSDSVRLSYVWNIDTGTLEYVNSSLGGSVNEAKSEDLRRQYNDDEEF